MGLAVLVEEWTRKLQSCEYAGEVAVSESELSDIANEIRPKIFSFSMPSTYRKCLLVLAVNCMYYKYNEEGFWIHFCKLLNVPDVPYTQNLLGEKLETELLSLKLLAHARSGPYRFISPLREQCGITKHEIPRFALFLNYLINRYGWEGIRALERDSFNEKVSSYVQGNRLRQFLLGDHGWHFTRDVARNVSQSLRQVLDINDLDHLHGYRTGFFYELFQSLDKTKFREEVFTRPPLPRLVFLPEFRQVALTFNQQYCNARKYKIKQHIVQRSTIPLDSEDLFKFGINGERLNSANDWEHWSISGWVPSHSRIALFHMEAGYTDHRKGLAPGRYYMLAPFDEPPPIDVQLNSYGMVDLPFSDLDYDAWLILIEPHTKMDFLGIIQATTNRVTNLISWLEETNRLPGTYEIEKAFTMRLPPIKVHRSDLFISNAVGLFIDDGGDTRRVGPEAIIDGKVIIDLPVNIKGRIWAEPISRMREFAGFDKLGELTFCLLPECHIVWPDRLYSLEDQPEVSLLADENISIELDDAVAIDQSKRKWQIMPRVAFVQGTIKSDGCEVSVVRRIFRAGVQKKHEKDVPILFPSDFQTSIDIIVSGYPQTKALVGITNGIRKRSLGELGIFNEAGELSSTTFAIIDALSGYKAPIGQFFLEYNSEEVRTDTLYIDYEKISEWLTNSKSSKNIEWWPLLPPFLAETIERTLLIHQAPLKEFPIAAESKSLPKELMSIFETLRRLCLLFDSSILPDRPEVTTQRILTEIQAENHQMGETTSWYFRAKKILNADNISQGNDAETLLLEYSKLSWIPPFQRWRDKIAHVARHLRDDVDLYPLLDEWRKDVERGFLATTSRIASQSGGRELTHAWVMYRESNLPGAVTKAITLLNGRISSPVADLTAILVRLCWLRLGYFKSQAKLEFLSTNKKLSLSYLEFESIIAFADWRNNLPVPATQNIFKLAEALPITPRDKSFFNLFHRSEYEFHVDDSKDWLEYYYALLLAKSTTNTDKIKDIAESLQSIIKNIPASPDKKLVIEIMERCL